MLPCGGASLDIKGAPIHRCGGATGGWVAHQDFVSRGFGGYPCHEGPQCLRGSVGCRPPQAAAGSLSHLVCFGFRLRVHHPLETRTWPFAGLQRLLGAAAFYTGWGQHAVLVRALLGSADRDVGRPSICPMTPVMWLELDHTKHRCFVLRRSSPKSRRRNPQGPEGPRRSAEAA